MPFNQRVQALIERAFIHWRTSAVGVLVMLSLYLLHLGEAAITRLTGEIEALLHLYQTLLSGWGSIAAALVAGGFILSKDRQPPPPPPPDGDKPA